VSDHIKQNRVVPIDKLTAHPRNYKKHPEAQIQRLITSLGRFGQGRSIVCQDGPEGYLIVAGHGIVEAAKKLRYTELRADILPAAWDADAVEGYLIADNMHSQGGEDDMVVLSQLLQEQQDAGFDLASLGTDEESLRQMLESLGDSYLGNGSDEEDSEPPAFKEYDESIADDLDTEMCADCGKLCVKSEGKGKKKDG
jgi:ParB-like chromosome segregation protein Spo0J